MDLNLLLNCHEQYRYSAISRRYLPFKILESFIQEIANPHYVKVLGASVNKLPLYSYIIGQGSTKILLWSQMHGNESTSTKSIFDLICFLQSDHALAKDICNKFELCILPMLNPDGANQYTRVNANGVDLNRDAALLTQPESKVLRTVYNNFAPHYCFNLHGQRTIFGFPTGKSSIMSFLTPAADQTRALNDQRALSMHVVSKIEKLLSSELKGNIGRYDDGYNINCTGDTYQTLGTPTILFEAGHYPGDYQREKTRSYFFSAIIAGFYGCLDKEGHLWQDYFNIPEHKKIFIDVCLTNILTIDGIKIKKLYLQYEEQLKSEAIQFMPKIVEIEVNDQVFAHKTIDLAFAKLEGIEASHLKPGKFVKEIRDINGLKIIL